VAHRVADWGWNSNVAALLSAGTLCAFIFSAACDPLLSSACLLPGVLGALSAQQHPPTPARSWLSSRENTRLLATTVLIIGLWLLSEVMHAHGEDPATVMLKTLFGAAALYAARGLITPLLEPYVQLVWKRIQRQR